VVAPPVVKYYAFAYMPKTSSALPAKARKPVSGYCTISPGGWGRNPTNSLPSKSFLNLQAFVFFINQFSLLIHLKTENKMFVNASPCYPAKYIKEDDSPPFFYLNFLKILLFCRKIKRR